MNQADIMFFIMIVLVLAVFFVMLLPMYLIELTNALVYVFEKISKLKKDNK